VTVFQIISVIVGVGIGPVFAKCPFLESNCSWLHVMWNKISAPPETATYPAIKQIKLDYSYCLLVVSCKTPSRRWRKPAWWLSWWCRRDSARLFSCRWHVV